MTLNRAMVLITAPALSLALLACVDAQEDVCSFTPAPGLSVVVRSASTGARLCDATVVAVDGSYRETLVAYGSFSGCVYEGAWERPGTYSVTAAHTAFAAATRSAVQVAAGSCHVDGASLDVELLPLAHPARRTSARR